MKRLFVFLTAALFSLSALALGFGNDNPGGNSTNLNSNANTQGQAQGQGQAQFTNVDVSNRISNDVRSNAASFAGAASKSSAVSGSVSAGGSAQSAASSGGNTLTVNEAAAPANTSVQYGGEYTVKNVPSVVMGSVYPTAPCMGSTTVGGSGVGFGIAVGTSWTDDECGIRETSRSFNGMGMKDDALKVLCSSKYAAVAPSCAKPE